MKNIILCFIFFSSQFTIAAQEVNPPISSNVLTDFMTLQNYDIIQSSDSKIIVFKRWGKAFYYNTASASFQRLGQHSGTIFRKNGRSKQSGIQQDWQIDSTEYLTIITLPKQVVGNTLFGINTVKNQSIKIVKTTPTSLSADNLMGTWVKVIDKKKFEASRNKRHKTFYVGHDQWNFLADNKIDKGIGIESTHLEKINGIDILFTFSDFSRMDRSIRKNIYYSQKTFRAYTMEILDDRHIILTQLLDPRSTAVNDAIFYLIKID